MQKLREEDECNRRMPKGTCSEAVHPKDVSTKRDGDLMGKKVYDPLSHVNAEQGRRHSPRSSLDSPVGGVGPVG